jgi:hypothetical protein
MPSRLKHALVLLVLLALVLGGAAWGWASLTKPFPPLTSDTPSDSPCLETAIPAGNPVRPGMVWVSVLNASDRSGLAGATLDQLVSEGFGEGATGNAPDGTDVAKAEIWTGDVESPAALLLKSYLGGKTAIVAHPELGPRVTVVVGQRFSEAKQGRKLVTAENDAVICSPLAS